MCIRFGNLLSAVLAAWDKPADHGRGFEPPLSFVKHRAAILGVPVSPSGHTSEMSWEDKLQTFRAGVVGYCEKPLAFVHGVGL